jgi:hypothetical protein
MFWQREHYRAATLMPFGQTFEVDLPRSGNLGSLGLVFSAAGVIGAFATTWAWRLCDYITRIELIGDGAEVIKSMDCRQAMASNFYDDKVVPFGLWRNYLAAPHRQSLVLNLGRYVHDTKHYLDMSRFSQVKLRITNNATAGQYATGIATDVICHWLREPKGASLGYYREEEWKLWAPAAATIEYTELPTALKIRRVLLRARPATDVADADNNDTIGHQMGTIDFSFRTGQTRVYQGTMDVLGRMSYEELGYNPETAGYICRTPNFGFDVGIGYVTTFVSAPASMGALPVAYPLTLAQGDVNDSTQRSIGYQADYPLHWQAKGYGYMHNVPLFDSDDPEDADILDPETEKVVKLDIACDAGTVVAGNVANAQSAIILSRLVP